MTGADRAMAASSGSGGSRTPGSLLGSLNTRLSVTGGSSAASMPRARKDPVKAGKDPVEWQGRGTGDGGEGTSRAEAAEHSGIPRREDRVKATARVIDLNRVPQNLGR